MPQSPGMNLPAGGPANRPIHFVHQVEKLFLFHGKVIKSVVPMPKIDVSKVAEILKKNQLEPALLRRLIEEQLCGSITRRLEATGVVCVLEFPLGLTSLCTNTSVWISAPSINDPG